MKRYSTETSTGRVRHLSYMGLECPVKIVVERQETGMVPVTKMGRLIAKTRAGRFVHALPGGGEVLGGPCA